MKINVVCEFYAYANVFSLLVKEKFVGPVKKLQDQ